MIESVLSSLFTLENLLWINVGLAGGIMVGALPGLTGTMAMALLLPLTYGLASIPGVMLLLGVYCGSIYGGSITAILINTPGTPASAATSLDGYPMAQKGHGLKALHVALSASTIGGLFSCAVLLFAAPPIASFALKFGPGSLWTDDYCQRGRKVPDQGPADGLCRAADLLHRHRSHGWRQPLHLRYQPHGGRY